MTMNEFKKIKTIRRDLHKIPEIAFNEFKTKEYIRDYVNKLNSFKKVYDEKYGIIYIKYSKGLNSKNIAFRAELDGLPINDNKNVSYISQHTGFSHSCGHDVHMAILLYSMYCLDKISVGNNIVFIFQSGEEVFGGAQYLLDQIRKISIDSIFSLHIAPDIPVNSIIVKEGEFLAENNTSEIFLELPQAHISSQSNYIEIFKSVAEFISEFNNDEQIIKVSNINDNGYYNINPSQISFVLNVRSFNIINFNRIISSLVKNIGQSTTIKSASKRIISNYPKLINSKKGYEIVKHVAISNKQKLVEPFKNFSSDDFSFYNSVVKHSTYFFIGCYLNDNYKCHTSPFNVNEDCLMYGYDMIMSIINYYKNY